MGGVNKDPDVKAASRPKPCTLFYSYAHEDESFRVELNKHLSVMRRNGEIAGWHDRKISAGTEWKDSIDEHLESARIVLLLVSSDFLDSDYCYDIEMKRAMERHEQGSARVIPIILRSCDWSSAPFAKLQALPKDARPIKTWGDPDEAYQNVVTGIRKAVKEMTGYLKQSPAAVWNVPFERNVFFTGRDRELKQVRRLLTKNKAAALSQAQAIYGLGGIGKTQLAVEYAYKYRESYKALFWIRADSEQSIITGYAEAARLLDLPEKDAEKIDETVLAVKRWLEREEGWLLIFDNADQPEVLKPYKPVNAKGHILITSRAHNFDAINLKNAIELREMLPDEAIKFLLDRGGRDEKDKAERDEAEKLAKELGYLPLALEQAGAYIREKRATIRNYRASYERERLNLLNKAKPVTGKYPESVATTWSMNFEEVKKESEAAIELLRVSAYLSPDSIPFEMIIGGRAELGDELAAALGEVEERPLAFDELLAPLIRYSLIRVDDESQTYSIHRMIQEVLKSGVEEAKREYAERVVGAVSRVFPSGFYETWTECERLLEQGKAAVELIEKEGLASDKSGRLLIVMGNYYSERGQYAEAEPLYNRSLRIREQMLGEHHPDVANSLNNLAALYYNQGRYAEAEPLYDRALKIWEQAFGEHHPSVAQSLNNLAMLYYNQGRYAEAEPLYDRALRIQEQGLGADHPDVATSLNNLAIFYRSQGRYAEAEPLYDRALKIWEQALGENHPDVATSLNNLAFLYRNQGRYREAEPLYDRSLRILEKALGEEHPNTTIVLRNYADLLRKIKRDAEAEELEARVKAICERLALRNIST